MAASPASQGSCRSRATNGMAPTISRSTHSQLHVHVDGLDHRTARQTPRCGYFGEGAVQKLWRETAKTNLANHAENRHSGNAS